MQLNAKGFSQAYCELVTYAVVHHLLQGAAMFVRCRVL